LPHDHSTKFSRKEEFMKASKSSWSILTTFSAVFLSILVMACEPATEKQDIPATQQDKIDVQQRLKELGIELPTPDAPIANYVQAVKVGNLVFLAGHTPKMPDGAYMTGKVGRDVDIDYGKEAARVTAINLLASLKGEIGDLNRVKRIVKVTGMVNATESFTSHPQVINGCSDLLVAVFGDRGKHARAAVGMASLPLDITTEIEMIVEVTD
jgi:enamine deaminase RidA (YjgF/YER057c/UK114 family)